jgi:hypothetical protein
MRTIGRGLAARPVLLVCLLILVLWCSQATGSIEVKKCFRDGKSAVREMNPFKFPKLKIFWGSWNTNKLATSVAAILLSEKLGFDVELVDGVTSRVSGVCATLLS